MLTRPPETFPERIMRLRTERRLSKAALSRRVGVSDVTVHYWESGKIAEIGHTKLLGLAQALGITVSELLDDPMLDDYRRAVIAQTQEATAHEQ